MSSQNSFIKYYNLETPYGNIHGMCKINNEIIATGIAWDTYSWRRSAGKNIQRLAILY